MKKVMGIHDISPDGVPISVEWKKLRIGESVFIPCLNTEDCIKQVKRITNRLSYKTRSSARIENKKYGVRIWRDK